MFHLVLFFFVRVSPFRLINIQKHYLGGNHTFLSTSGQTKSGELLHSKINEDKMFY